MKDSDQIQPEKIFSVEVTKASLEHAGISLTCQKDDYFFHCFVSIILATVESYTEAHGERVHLLSNCCCYFLKVSIATFRREWSLD